MLFRISQHPQLNLAQSKLKLHKQKISKEEEKGSKVQGYFQDFLSPPNRRKVTSNSVDEFLGLLRFSFFLSSSETPFANLRKKKSIWHKQI